MHVRIKNLALTLLILVIALPTLVGMVNAANFPRANSHGAFGTIAAVNPYDDNSTVVTTETTQSTSEVTTSPTEVVTTTTTSETVTSSTEVITTTSAATSTTSDNSTSSTETVTTNVTSTTTTENTVTSSTETQTTTTYQVVFEVNPSGAGSTNPSGGMTYDAGSSISISATANSGYAFSGWSVSDASSIALADSSSPTTTATINGVGTITADFNPTTVNPADTQTAVFCSPSSVEVGGSVTCTATVTGGSSVTGQTVSWGSAGSGMFDSVECALGDSGSCSVTYSPTDAGDGSHTITANYAGDANHNASTGNFTLTVTGGTTTTTTVVTSVTSSGTAKIWTDREDYSPGDTPAIYGSGFLANAEVTISVTRPEETQNSWPVTTDDSGSFTTSYATDTLVSGTFTVTATDGTNTATTTFTDTAPAFTATISPTSALTGETKSYTLTITPSSANTSPLGSATIDIPAGFTGVSITTVTAPAGKSWTGNVVGSQIKLNANSNGDRLTEGTSESVSVTFTATAPSPPTSTVYTWTTAAFSGTDFKGGNFDISGPQPTVTVAPSNALPLTVGKTANPSFTRTFTWGITKSVDKTEVDIASGGTATFNYVVTVTHDSGTDSGWKVIGTITVTNPNTAAVLGVTVTDSINDPNAVCTVAGGSGVTIPASSSSNFAYSCTYSAAPSSSGETNTATVTWSTQTLSNGQPLTGGSATGTASIDWSSVTPTIVDGSVTVTDTYGGSLGTVLYTDASPKTFTYSHDFTGDSGGTCTNHDNTAKIVETDQSASKTVKVCVGVDLTVSKTATPTFTRTYTWGISKSVDKTEVDIASGGTATFGYTVTVTHDSGTASGWQVTGTITVTNPNDWEAITADVADAVDNGGTCTVTGGTNVVVPKSSSVQLSYTCTYSSAPSPLGGTNTATATWDKAAFFTPDGSATGTASFDFGSVTPTIVDGSVTVSDTLGGALGSMSYTDSSPKTFTYSHTFTGDTGGTCTSHDNTATFTTNTSGTTGSSSATVKVCVGVDLTVSKIATPSFTRTYAWTITKSVDKTKQTIVVGSTATFNYVVTVTETGFTDSDWQVTGTITVTNPNDWESITATVTDAVDNGGSCTVTGGTNVVVDASKSVDLPYTCTYASAPNPSSGTNTATATWDKAAFFTPDGSATGTATFDISTPTTTVNKVVTVTDTLDGTTTTLGTLTAVDTTPFTSATFTYSYSFNGVLGQCTSYTNTAKIVETSQTESKRVTVCVVPPSAVTDSSLCPIPNNQFVLIYVSDPQNPGYYRMVASNPGQFYDNIFVGGTSPVLLNIQIPYPFITQGAVPIHVYGDASYAGSCFVPINDITSQFTIKVLNSAGTDVTSAGQLSPSGKPTIILDNYIPGNLGSTVTVTVSGPSSGLVYVTIHLDYGLKGSKATGWTKGAPTSTACYGLYTGGACTGTGSWTLDDPQSYSFNSPAITVSSTNHFKKDPGIAGLVLNTDGTPMPNVQVKVIDSKGKPVATLTTDSDGAYLWEYKYTGKPTTYTVSVPAYSLNQSVTFKSNNFVIVNFQLPNTITVISKWS